MLVAGVASLADTSTAHTVIIPMTGVTSSHLSGSAQAGGYTAARTLGGWHGGAVVLLDYHVGRCVLPLSPGPYFLNPKP